MALTDIKVKKAKGAITQVLGVKRILKGLANIVYELMVKANHKTTETTRL